jgi:hypothetical protein
LSVWTPTTDPPEWMFCCDPGLVSGIAVLRWTKEDGLRHWESSEGSLVDVGNAAREFLRAHHQGQAEVVIERFTITAETAKNSQAPWSLKVCGVVEWLVADNWDVVAPDKTVIYQSPAEAKSLVPNEILQAAGIWHRGGAGHARDALRHGVYRFATKHRVRDAWDTLLATTED